MERMNMLISKSVWTLERARLAVSPTSPVFMLSYANHIQLCIYLTERKQKKKKILN